MKILAIKKALQCGMRFYAYRLPGESKVHFGAQISQEECDKWFCVHPFIESHSTPTVKIMAQIDAAEVVAMTYLFAKKKKLQITDKTTSKEDYLRQAKAVISQLREGEMDKVVLSRTICGSTRHIDWVEAFERLLENDSAYVFIFNSEETGAWIGATPERYLSHSNDEVKTMALAGTRETTSPGEWSEKDRAEQAVVTHYIAKTLTQCGANYVISPIKDYIAGNVKHLCNDFLAKNMSEAQIEELKKCLHPTPAVAGMPKAKAMEKITQTELHNRRYYSGYVGAEDKNGNFEYFVNLRSLAFDDETYCIFVGSGLTAASVAENEWSETQAKAQMMLNAIK